MTIEEMLALCLSQRASDLHLMVGSYPTLRIQGLLTPIDGQAILDAPTAQALVFGLLTQEQKDQFLVNKEVDFSYQYRDSARFRVNVYYHRGTMAAALRLISNKIATIEELRMPSIVHQFTTLRQGLILVTGPTGHGKTSTIAALIDEINTTRAEHILTIEDPIEYIFTPKKSVISQRELQSDTHSWDVALRSALREDPDVVLVGEMRDFETISSALTIAETGHVVFATLHTNSASQTIDRIIDVFPEHQQGQVRMQLANTLQAVVSQRLVRTLQGDRVPAVELLLANGAVRNIIREGKTFQLDNVISTSSESGMVSLETSLSRLVNQGQIAYQTAQELANYPEQLERMIQKA